MSSSNRRYPVAIDAPVSLRRSPGLPTVRAESRIVSHRADDGNLAVSAQCRVVRAARRQKETVESTSILLVIDATREIIRVDGDDAGLDGLELHGLKLGGGIRRHLASRAGAVAPLTSVLLDQLPGASVVAGYQRLYDAKTDPTSAASPGRQTQVPKADICAGWRSEGTMVTLIRSDGGLPVPIGPIIDPSTADDSGWDPEVVTLLTGAVRREIGYEVAAGSPVPVGRSEWQVDAWLRDSHLRPDGNLGAVHQYSMRAEVDDAGVVRSARATPRVLPWPECPAAVDSVARLVGESAIDVRVLVGSEFRGVSTCTHLNDLARGLAEVPRLIDMIPTE